MPLVFRIIIFKKVYVVLFAFMFAEYSILQKDKETKQVTFCVCAFLRPNFHIILNWLYNI